jgi:hypothetical protein
MFILVWVTKWVFACKWNDMEAIKMKFAAREAHKPTVNCTATHYILEVQAYA